MNAEDAKAKQPLIDAVPGRHSGDVCFAGTRVPVSTLSSVLPAATRWLPSSRASRP